MKDINTHIKNKPPDDGFRHMPKLRCPYGNHRFGDVPDVDFRNTVTLLKYENGRKYGYGDAIFICPVCHQRAVVQKRAWTSESTLLCNRNIMPLRAANPFHPPGSEFGIQGSELK